MSKKWIKVERKAGPRGPDTHPIELTNDIFTLLCDLYTTYMEDDPDATLARQTREIMARLA